MLKIGRYGIDFGRNLWFQTRVLTRTRLFLCLFWILKEARPTDIDKVKRFPLGTLREFEGIRYHYYKAGEDIVVKQVVKEN